MEEHSESMTKDDMCKLPSLLEAPWLILIHENDESEFEDEIEDDYELEDQTEDEPELENQTVDEPELKNQTEDESELENYQTEDESELEDETEDEYELEDQTEDESELDNQTEDEPELEDQTVDEPELENYQTFCTMNNKSYTKKIVELDGKSILASNQGWLILQERINPSKYSLWNPVTLQCLVLPELLDPPEEEERPRICIFTSPPDGDAPCVLLLFFYGLVFLCRPTMREDCKWIKRSLEHDGQTVQIFNAAALNGDIYAYAYLYRNGGVSKAVFAHIKVTDSDSDSDSDSNLILFEPMEIQIPYQCMIKFRNYSQYSSNYLVEVRGVLYAVHVMKRQVHVMEDYDIVKTYVWRLDFSQMKWIQVESLGNCAFLLGYGGCTWCWADDSCSGIEGNCIYMTYPRSLTVHQYRLQDDSYIFLSPYSNLLENWFNPIWFMPHNPTRISPEKLITENVKDIENTKHVEELEETEMDQRRR